MQREKEYLAAGFKNIDETDAHAVYTACLNYIDTIPYFREIKERSYEQLKLKEAKAVLEIGCGMGADIFRMAQRVSEHCMLTGIDQSRFMLEKAKSDPRFALYENIVFSQADARVLPFASQSFDRCRMDRTLQHIALPQKALNEAFRVLETGGIFVVYDNDWSTFSLSLSDTRLSRIVETYWCDAFENGRIAIELKGYLHHAGFTQINCCPSTLVLEDFATADRIYDIEKTVLRAQKEKYFTQEEAKAIVEELKQQTEEGTFLCALTSYTFTALKGL